MKEDRRNTKTTKAIKQEILRQMLEKKYTELTVSAVCESLDLSRRTFYLHFQDIQDVFTKLFDEINQPLYEGIRKLEQEELSRKDDDYALSEILRLINNTIENNTEYLRRLATEPSYSHIQAMHISLMKNLINDYLTVTDTDSLIRSVYLDYYLSGILELYFQWYRHEQELSLDDIRSFALEIMKTDRKYFFGNLKRTGGDSHSF